MSTMTIENGKEGAFGPAVTFLLRWLLHIQDNRHSIFIVVTHDTLIRIRRVGLHHAILLN